MANLRRWFSFRSTRLYAGLIAVAALTLLWPDPVHAQLGDAAEKTVSFIAVHLIYPVVQLLGNLLVAFINILLSVASYNDFIRAAAVDKGWQIVRDVANMFFIVVLLVIAIGTILNSQTYRYNRLLPRLVIMAFLVNFSKFIAGFIIDVAQIIMLTFVSAFRGAAAGNLTQAFGLRELLSLRSVPANEVSGYTIVGSMLLALGLVTVALIVVGAYVVILLIRIIALWLLIVLSPLAYALRTFPAGQAYASRWWDSFTKYVICGPVIAFFLWLALTVVQVSVQDGGKLGSEVATPAGETETVVGGGSAVGDPLAASITEISRVDNLLSFLLGILLLLGSLMMAQQLCGAAGQFAGKMQQRARRAAMLATGAAGAVSAARSVGRGAAGATKFAVGAPISALNRFRQTRTGALGNILNPGTAIKQWVKVRGEQNKRAADIAEAGGRQMAERNILGVDLPRQADAEIDQAEAFSKNFRYMSPAQLADQHRAISSRGGRDGMMARRALALDIATRGMGRAVAERVHGIDEHTAGADARVLTAADIQGTLTQLVPENDPARETLIEAAVKNNHPEYVGQRGLDRAAGFEPNQIARLPVEALAAQRRVVIRDVDANGVASIRHNAQGALETRLAAAAINPENVPQLQRQERLSNRDIRNIPTRTAESMIAHSDQVRAGVADVSVERMAFLQQLHQEYPRVFSTEMKKIGATQIQAFDPTTGNITHGDYGQNFGGMVVPGRWQPELVNTNDNAQELRDVDTQQFTATRERVQAYQAQEKNFFDSAEYRQSPEKFLSKDSYEVSQQLEENPRNDVGGIASYGSGKSNFLAFNAQNFQGGKYKDVAGAYLTDKQQIQEFAKEYLPLVEQEITQLEQSGGDQVRLEHLRRAKERLSDPSKLADLKLVNTGRVGYSARHVVGHEDTHAKLDAVDADGTLRKQMLDGLSPEKRQEIQSQMQKKMGNASMSMEDAWEEYLTEGMTNEWETWADTQPDAVRFDPKSTIASTLSAEAAKKGIKVQRSTLERTGRILPGTVAATQAAYAARDIGVKGAQVVDRAGRAAAQKTLGAASAVVRTADQGRDWVGEKLNRGGEIVQEGIRSKSENALATPLAKARQRLEEARREESGAKEELGGRRLRGYKEIETGLDEQIRQATDGSTRNALIKKRVDVQKVIRDSERRIAELETKRQDAERQAALTQQQADRFAPPPPPKAAPATPPPAEPVAAPTPEAPVPPPVQPSPPVSAPATTVAPATGEPRAESSSALSQAATDLMDAARELRNSASDPLIKVTQLQEQLQKNAGALDPRAARELQKELAGIKGRIEMAGVPDSGEIPPAAANEAVEKALLRLEQEIRRGNAAAASARTARPTVPPPPPAPRPPKPPAQTQPPAATPTAR